MGICNRSRCNVAHGLLRRSPRRRPGVARRYSQIFTLFHSVKVIQLAPNDADGYFGWAVSYQRLGQYQNAISDYTKAIQLDPDDGMPYANRGAAYLKLGQHPLANADFAKACSLETPPPPPPPAPNPEAGLVVWFFNVGGFVLSAHKKIPGHYSRGLCF